jgi:hypothetical protein
VQEQPTITAAEIARLAGVGRAAVSNWRRRHPDFPTPVGGTATSPEFDLGQVERWLRGQGKLPELSALDRLWHQLANASDDLAATLATVGAALLAHQRDERPPHHSGDARLRESLAEVTRLADDLGARQVFDELWQRYVTTGRGRDTPEELAELMVGLADVHAGTVLDPACGAGTTLRAAVRAGCTAAYGQEIEDAVARLAGVWTALRKVPGQVCPGDSLRADAFTGRLVDAVVCHPPFGVSNWGQEELGYDSRWEYGTPPRTEPELAWVQHCLAHLRPGGQAVVLMPPAAASRRAGRRIRGELLRRGALRAVAALPAGAAAPHGVPLHLWVLRRPVADEPAPARALLLDAAEAADGELPGVYARVLAAWRAFADGSDTPGGEAGFARSVPVIELLDEEIDLTPARRQPAAGTVDTGDHLLRTRERLAAVVADLPELVPPVVAAGGVTPAPTVSVAELVRTGAVQLIGPVRATAGADGDAPSGADVVLTAMDVVRGDEPSGDEVGRLAQRVRLTTGDVVVPMVARQLTARVVTGGGALLGRNLYLLRPNPAAVDSWFLAGQLRSSANEKQTSSLGGTLRFDIRRAQVRRLPLAEQRAFGEAFRRLCAFESAIRQATDLGAELVRLTADGLAVGVLKPGEPAP